ncbi:hypothetical protein J3F84DRAFT_371563 [Trichoderma pleuroticola]
MPKAVAVEAFASEDSPPICHLPEGQSSGPKLKPRYKFSGAIPPSPQQPTSSDAETRHRTASLDYGKIVSL